jgi:tetratricopeptide (TPR) repeat protein
MALLDLGQAEEAIRASRKAIELDPSGTIAHFGLGRCWQDRGQLDEAVAEFRRAIELDPKLAAAHHHLGMCWQAKVLLDKAMAEFRRAIELDPKGAHAHYGLGMCWQDRGQLDEAMAEYRRAIGLDPELAAAHHQLGRCWQDRGQLDEAVAEFRRAIELDPKLAAAHHYLSTCLYDAACAAVRAAAGQGSEKAPLSEPERAGLHRQALDRLRANLELRTKLLQDGQRVGWSLAPWQTDPALASVRDRAALAKLPDAERAQWQRLWADVTALLAADPLEQGRSRAARREWAQAADGYARALKGGSTDDGHFWFEYAALLLLSGDRSGYARACSHLIERCDKASDLRAYHVARACTLAPDAVADVSVPRRLSEKELRDSAREFWSLTEQGALAYRAGRYQESVPLFEQSLQADPKVGRAVLNWLWLALAHQRLGKAEEARRWLGKAQAWLDQYRDGIAGPCGRGARLALPQLARSARPAPRGGSITFAALDGRSGGCRSCPVALAKQKIPVLPLARRPFRRRRQQRRSPRPWVIARSARSSSTR